MAGPVMRVVINGETLEVKEYSSDTCGCVAVVMHSGGPESVVLSAVFHPCADDCPKVAATTAMWADNRIPFAVMEVHDD